MRMSRKTITVLIIVLAAMGYGIYQVAQTSPVSIPEEFSTGRDQSAVIAADIVATSEEIARSLDEVVALNRVGEKEEASQVISNISEQSKSIRTQAQTLSEETERMTRSLEHIDSEQVRNAAIEALNYRLELIGFLVTYSNEINELLELLRDHVASGNVSEEQITEHIDRINASVQAINQLNNQANEAIERFDRLTE